MSGIVQATTVYRPVAIQWIWSLCCGKIWKSAPNGEQSSQRTSCAFGVRMARFRTAKIQHFAITVNGHLFILTTMMPEVSFHQPRLSMLGIDVENPIDKDLRYFPSFF